MDGTFIEFFSVIMHTSSFSTVFSIITQPLFHHFLKWCI